MTVEALIKLKEKAKDYGNFPDDHKVLKKLDEIKDEWEKQSTNSTIANAGKVVETAIYAIDDLQSKNPYDVIKGGLAIVGSIATLVGGPYGAAAGAVCGVLAAIISVSAPKKPDMATVFANKVRTELERFKRNEQLRELEGLGSLMKNMIDNLRVLGPTMSDLSKDSGLPNKSLYERDFQKFIAEVSKDFTENLYPEDQESINGCVNAMVVYCHAQMSFMLLLANIIATFKATGRDTKLIRDQLERQKEDAKEKLGFLSETRYLCSTGLLPLEGGAGGNGGKMLKIFHLQNKFLECGTVEEFRTNLGMTKMPKFSFIQEKIKEAKKFKLKLISEDHYPRPERDQKDHFFQLINHTGFPIKIVCGTAGDHVNGLSFKEDISPYSSYEHVASKVTRFFSVGGYFIIYFDRKYRSFETPFDHDGPHPNFKVFEFALSNPSIGGRKMAYLEKNKLENVTGEECWDGMTEPTNPLPNKYFAHENKHYVLAGHYTKSPNFIPLPEDYIDPTEVKKSPYIDGANSFLNIVGKVVSYHPYAQLLPGRFKPAESVTDSNFSRTWTFVVQQVDADIIPPK